MESVPASESASSGSALGSTMSLLILHQLEDKQTALEFYINFLQEVGLWKRVSTYFYYRVTLFFMTSLSSALWCDRP